MSEEKGRQITLCGRVVLTGQVVALTGLHIGTSKESLEIGGVDMQVVRNPVDRVPYIPGSSLKGKMRSLWEKVRGKRFETRLKDDKDPAKRVFIHTCDDTNCEVCSIYGTTGDTTKDAPTRLMIRDIPLDKSSLPETVVDFTEVKWEAAIDRVTSAASPRQMERVPAGAVFAPLEIVFSIYGPADVNRFAHVLTGLQLVEDDFLGGQGSRGSGKVRFEELRLMLRGGKEYQDFDFKAFNDREAQERNLATLVGLKGDIQTWLRQALNL